MVFLSICTALYDYTPQGEGELAIQEGELVYVLEKSTEDDWWKARKKATNEDEAEPVGLIPYNYVGEVRKQQCFHTCLGDDADCFDRLRVVPVELISGCLASRDRT